MLKSYPDVAAFKKGFEVSQTDMDSFLEMAKTMGVEWDEDNFKRSETLLRYQIKALIARNLWDLSAYYEVMTDTDETLQRALNILAKEDIFSYLKAPRQ